MLGRLAMALDARELADRLAVPFQAEPGKTIDDRLNRRLGRALAVGVLDAQQEPPAEALGVEPVEQRRARAANVQKAGRGGRKSRHDLGHSETAAFVLKRGRPMLADPARRCITAAGRRQRWAASANDENAN